MTKAEHLSSAKRDIAAGTKSFRSAANHIAGAIAAGATQTEAAAKVGKSQPWVSQLLKWKAAGFKAGGPFAADHARAIISAANNPTRAAHIRDGYHHVEEQRELNSDGTPFDGLRRVYVKRVSDPEPKEPIIVSASVVQDDQQAKVVHLVPQSLLEKVATLEKAAADLCLSVQLHGGITVAGEAIEDRIAAVVDKLQSLTDPVQQGDVA
jgi:hypothetical protein